MPSDNEIAIIDSLLGLVHGRSRPSIPDRGSGPSHQPTLPSPPRQAEAQPAAPQADIRVSPQGSQVGKSPAQDPPRGEGPRMPRTLELSPPKLGGVTRPDTLELPSRPATRFTAETLPLTLPPSGRAASPVATVPAPLPTSKAATSPGAMPAAQNSLPGVEAAMRDLKAAILSLRDEIRAMGRTQQGDGGPAASAKGAGGRRTPPVMAGYQPEFGEAPPPPSYSQASMV